MLQIRQELAAANESHTRNDAALRRYAWTARTEVSQKGKIKQTTTESRRYGTHGIIQTVPAVPPAATQQPDGVIRRAADAGSDLPDAEWCGPNGAEDGDRRTPVSNPE
jgi:hypothetical protein